MVGPRLKVRLVAPEHLPERSETTARVAALATALSARGHDVVVATAQAAGSCLPQREVGADGVTVRRFASAGCVRGQEISPALWHWLREGADDADVVHVHDVQALTSLPALTVAPRPLVLSPHLRAGGPAGSQAWARQVHASAARRALQRVSRVLCSTPDESDRFVARFGGASRVLTVTPGRGEAAVVEDCYLALSGLRVR